MFLDSSVQKLDAKKLSDLIPHKGPMVLLDWVEEWDDDHILCSTRSHVSKQNPLRINDALSTIHSIEYGAQAASLHTALLSVKYEKPLVGIEQFGAITTAFLAIVREFHFSELNLNDCDDVMMVRAYAPNIGPRLLQYQVRVEIQNQVLAHGVISLVVEG
jgi:predicted hotdog family 3-hydroxylacyl-ACP dehydratase